LKILDIILIVLLVWGLVKGYRRGMIVEILGLLGLVAAIGCGFALLKFGVDLAKPYAEETGQFLPYLVFVGIFVLVLVVIGLIGRLIRESIKHTFLGSFDSLAGSIIGVFKAVFIVSLLFWIVAVTGIGMPDGFTDNTYLYPYVADIAPATIKVVSQFSPYMREMFDSLSKLFAEA
jgi:membrane protein required for colicin V production